MIRHLLRAVAIGIAVAAVLDPQVSGQASLKPPATIAIVDPGAGPAAARLAGALADDFDVVVRQVRPGDRAAACVEDGPCVLVSGGGVPARIAANPAAPVWALRLPAAVPGVAVLEATPGLAGPDAAASVLVRLQGTGVSGRRTRVTVGDAGVPVGETDVDWTADGERAVSVAWWPMGDGPRRLRVTAATAGDEDPGDDVIDVAAETVRARLPVLVYEPRPSWAATFVRRALEADPRWDVRLVARLGPTVAITTGGQASLTDAMLSAARVVVVGAPEAVEASDRERLERFVRVRGGTLVLLPDRAPAGPLVGLAGRWRERLEESPVAVGDLRATELLVAEEAPSATVLARAGEAPVVVAVASGRGRVVVGGAMDAWRYRAEGESAFDRFWQALVASGAEAAGPELSLTPSPRLVAPGQEVTVDVRMRTMARAEGVRVNARFECLGGTAGPIRLWPTGPEGAFTGTIRPGAEGRCEIVASGGAAGGAAPLEASAAVIVAADATKGGAAPGLLDQVVGTSGGRVVPAGQEPALAAALRDDWPAVAAAVRWHPMRSPWWLLIFAACLGTEWYLRRASGLR